MPFQALLLRSYTKAIITAAGPSPGPRPDSLVINKGHNLLIFSFICWATHEKLASEIQVTRTHLHRFQDGWTVFNRENDLRAAVVEGLRAVKWSLPQFQVFFLVLALNKKNEPTEPWQPQSPNRLEAAQLAIKRTRGCAMRYQGFGWWFLFFIKRH